MATLSAIYDCISNYLSMSLCLLIRACSTLLIIIDNVNTVCAYICKASLSDNNGRLVI